MIFINYHLIKLELRQYHPDMEFGVDGLRRILLHLPLQIYTAISKFYTAKKGVLHVLFVSQNHSFNLFLSFLQYCLSFLLQCFSLLSNSCNMINYFLLFFKWRQRYSYRL